MTANDTLSDQAIQSLQRLGLDAVDPQTRAKQVETYRASVRAALDRNKWRLRATARDLGIDHQNLLRRISVLGMLEEYEDRNPYPHPRGARKLVPLPDVKLEKGIPLPPPEVRRHSGLAEVARTMEPGDSFLIPCDWAEARSKMGYASAWNKKLAPKEFAARKVEGGLRIWRTK